MKAVAHALLIAALPIGILAQSAPDNALSVSERRDSAVIQQIQARMRTASGTFIRGDAATTHDASLATDLIRRARGFRWKGPTLVETRGTAPQARNALECESQTRSDAILARGLKSVAVYLDGSRLSGGLEMINRMVPVDDVLAVEAYPDVLSAPAQWRTNDACAVIAFWTRRL
jgi:hypothetical protein